MYDNIRNKHIKSTVRGNLRNYWRKRRNPYSSLIKYKACSSSGKIIDSKSPFNDPPDHKYAILKHYYYKSFEEFCKKIYRGWPDTTDKNEIINYLIYLHKNNTEKIKIINKIFKFNLTHA